MYVTPNTSTAMYKKLRKCYSEISVKAAVNAKIDKTKKERKCSNKFISRFQTLASPFFYATRAISRKQYTHYVNRQNKSFILFSFSRQSYVKEKIIKVHKTTYCKYHDCSSAARLLVE